MAYEIAFTRPLPAEFRRIARELLVRSAGELEGRDSARGVHEARKRLKRLRSLLRLMQGPLGRAHAVQNARFRDAARALSGLREARVLGQTAAALAGQSRHAAKLLRPVAEHFNAAYAAMSGPCTSHDDAMAQTIAGIVADLTGAAAEIDAWPVDALSADDAVEALTHGFRAGRRAMARAGAAPTAEAFHQWRKYVQRHWHHMRLARGLWPEAMIAREDAARRLADVLGRDHDLAVLAETVGRCDAFKQRGAIVDMVRARQAELRGEAASGGRRLYAERPGELAHRLKVYWRIAEEGGSP